RLLRFPSQGAFVSSPGIYQSISSEKRALNSSNSRPVKYLRNFWIMLSMLFIAAIYHKKLNPVQTCCRNYRLRLLVSSVLTQKKPWFNRLNTEPTSCLHWESPEQVQTHFFQKN